MGIWKKSPLSAHIARTHPGLQEEFRKTIPGYKPSDIIGSPYAIFDYEPEPDLCSSWEDLAAFHKELRQNGVKLILDFVPNHMSLDSPWIDKTPLAFLEVKYNPEENPNCFRHASGRVLAHGKDPYFDGWTDTVQFDFSSSHTLDLHLFFLNRISEYCDGLRCDMAMLALADIFQLTHGKRGFEYYWEEMIQRVKQKKKDFIFIAEVYWGLDSLLQMKGFDFTYDKDLYDCLLQKNTNSLICHLQRDSKYIRSTLKFLENHDESRMNSTFFRDSVPFFSLLANVPGSLLIHEGQSQGLRKKIPVQIGTYPHDDEDEYIKNYFDRILPRFRKRKETSLQKLLCKPVCYENKDLFCIARILFYDGKDREIFIFNPYNMVVSGRILFSKDEIQQIFPEGNVSLLDLTNGYNYVQIPEEVAKQGLYFKLDAWSCHWFLVL